MNNDLFNNAKKNNSLAWCGTINDFLSLSYTTYSILMHDQYRRFEWTENEPSQGQKNAWITQYHALQTTLNLLSDSAKNSLIVFEFGLPGEAGRRAADVNIVTDSGQLFVIDFKHKEEPTQSDIDKLNSDAKSLKNFHSESHDLNIIPMICLTIQSGIGKAYSVLVDRVDSNGVLNMLLENINSASKLPSKWQNSATTHWLSGRYERKPSVLRGTVELFIKNKIPSIWGDDGKSIINLRSKIVEHYRDARTNKKQKLLLVSGTPGSGKTLLGLSVVAELVNQHNISKPIYFSGNGPLIGTLKYAIKSIKSTENIDPSSFIQSARFIKKELNGRRNIESFDFVVFDESQRAWKNKKNDELYFLISWLKGQDDGAVLVLLVGNGQSIHKGELTFEDFLTELSGHLVKKEFSDIEVIGCSSIFRKIKNLKDDSSFYLKNSIRQEFDEQFHQWVEHVLECRPEDAATLSSTMKYPIRIYNNIKNCEDDIFNIKNKFYESENAFKYGWYSSSKGGQFSNKQQLFAESGKEENVYGSWYANESSNDNSCCQLRSYCTEFGAQGLELSYALVNWNKDFIFRNGDWFYPEAFKRENNEFTKSVYRVLLTRGRYGLIINCNDAETYEYLKRCISI
ncbi:MAG: DUF2075 domain-containing protein [Thiotrichales bacterium]|nr:DUF2075 domain-containing protein [Thiotrichales bacterium]